MNNYMVTLGNRTPPNFGGLWHEQQYHVRADSELEAEAEAFSMAEEDGRGFSWHVSTEEVPPLWEPDPGDDATGLFIDGTDEEYRE